jgi:hypothetical protein
MKYARVLALLHSTAVRESNRIDLSLARAVFLIMAGLVLLPVAKLRGGPRPIGPYMLQALMGPSLFLMVFLAMRLGGDSVGDVRCGMLELLFLSDTKPAHWLAVRVAQMWIGFLSVWIVRAPLLMIVYCLGGLRPETILVSELLMATGFLLLSSLALLVSFRAKSRRQVFGFVLAGVLAWEFLLMAPSIVTGLLSQYYNQPVSLATISAAATIRELGLTSCFRYAVFRPLTFVDVWPTAVTYGVLAALILVRFHRVLSVYASGVSVEARAAQPEGRQRVSRRCWDDALAWQAFTIHGGGRRLVLAKCAGFLALAALMLYLAERRYEETAFILSVLTAGVALLIAVNKTGDCLSREIKEQTITMLLLTPNGPDDFYAGWQRGMRRLAWPDVLLGVGVTIVSARVDAAVPPILIAIGAALLSSGPFLMLSPLVPFSVQGISTGVVLIVGLIVILAIAVSVGALVSPVLVPVVSIPLCVIYNQMLRRLLLPYWMQQKISSII